MSQITETICDQCGARKTKSNHWWKCQSNEFSFHFRPSGNLEKTWENELDLCSEGCATRAFSDFIDKQRIAKDLTEEILNQAEKEFEESLDRNQQ